MTASPATTAPTPVLTFVGGDTEPSDEFLDVLVEILWDAAERQLGDRDGDQDKER